MLFYLLIFSILGSPLHAMDGDHNSSFLNRALSWSQEHPKLTAFGAVLLGGVLVREFAFDAPKRRNAAFIARAQDPSIEQITELMKDQDYIHQKNDNGKTPLDHAVRCSQANKVRLLLQHKAPINPSMLYHAAKTYNMEIAQLLISYGADINMSKYCKRFTFQGETWFNTSVTPLMIAAREENSAMLQLLLRNNADVFQVVQCTNDKYAQLEYHNALSIAAISEKEHAVRIIVQEAPFSPIKDPDDACVTFNVLLVFKQYGVSKDVRPIILSYMPQYIPNRKIFVRVFNYCGSSPELVKSCPLSWFKHVYDNTEKKNKESLLSVLTEDIAEYRLSQVGRLLITHTVAEYRKNLFAHAKILKLLDIDQIEQHRQPIEEAVQYYLETRPYRI